MLGNSHGMERIMTAFIAGTASRSTVLRVIRAGRIPAIRDVFARPACAGATAARVDAVSTESGDATDLLVAELRQVIADLRRGQEDLRHDRDRWQAAHEREQAAHAATQRLLMPAHAATQALLLPPPVTADEPDANAAEQNAPAAETGSGRLTLPLSWLRSLWRPADAPR
jgi:hypothetical protein